MTHPFETTRQPSTLPALPDPAFVASLAPGAWEPVLAHLFQRYEPLCRPSGPCELALGDELANRAHWLCETALESLTNAPMAQDKANRWLGFVQGVLVVAQVLDIEVERVYTRPLFHAINGPAPSLGPAAKR